MSGAKLVDVVGAVLILAAFGAFLILVALVVY